MTENGNPLLIDEETLEADEEIYEIHAGGYEDLTAKWTPTDADEVIVDKLLRETRYYREQIARLEALERDEIERIRERTATLARRHRFALRRREDSLEAFSEATGGARRVSPCGTLRWKVGSERVRFLDADGAICDNEERFLECVKDDELVKTTRAVSKTKVKALVRGGDAKIRHLAVMDRGEPTFIVEVPA